MSLARGVRGHHRLKCPLLDSSIASAPVTDGFGTTFVRAAATTSQAASDPFVGDVAFLNSFAAQGPASYKDQLPAQGSAPLLRTAVPLPLKPHLPPRPAAVPSISAAFDPFGREQQAAFDPFAAPAPPPRIAAAVSNNPFDIL